MATGSELTKLDLRKQLRHLYQPSAKAPSAVHVPRLQYLMVDGQGDPNTARAYHEAIQVLFSLSYTLKFHVRKVLGVDYPVMPLEGLWWPPEGETPESASKDTWLWTAFMLQPDLVTPELVAESAGLAQAKRDLPALPLLRLQAWEEGEAAQIMHIGPYAAEAPTIARLHAFIAEQRGEPCGKHHEIYLGDPRRTAPERLKTVLRQPFRRLAPDD